VEKRFCKCCGQEKFTARRTLTTQACVLRVERCPRSALARSQCRLMVTLLDLTRVSKIRSELSSNFLARKHNRGAPYAAILAYDVGTAGHNLRRSAISAQPGIHDHRRFHVGSRNWLDNGRLAQPFWFCH